MPVSEHDKLVTAIAALEGQRELLGDAVLEVAVAPLRARLAALQRGPGLQLRRVSVLFADVVGSTAMAGALDAEDTLQVLSETLGRMATLIEAHGGRVLRFTGDGVKAAFGMDEAREDDPERAVRAGLAILAAGRDQADAARREHGIADFALRVGVHTGDVALGAGIEADNTAMGAAVNIAARMEQSAPPGSLRISHDTCNHVRGLFELEPQPPLAVKGVEAPMQTYLVHAARDRTTASVERGLQGLKTPLVGRDAELQRLLQAVADVHGTGRLQAVTLVGDAGLGKSRLLRELLAAQPGSRVQSVRSQPDGQLRPWGVLRSLLATRCGVADTDSADVARRKVVDSLAPGFAEDGQRQTELIGQLSGLDFGDSLHVRGLDPRELRDKAFSALRSWLRTWAAQGDTLPVLVVEDLHWADDSSLDLLQHLLLHAAELPLALLMSARPALLTRRPDWAAAPAVVPTLLQLGPLVPVHRNDLAQALLQRIVEVPAELSTLIVERSDGNPYYMEELVRRLIDDGVILVGETHWTVQLARLADLRLPGTLVGLLRARLDALPAAERQAARQASIVGHVFWDDALRALDPAAPQALPALETSTFVKTHEGSDFEGTAERQFDHHLLHQATYDTLLKSERRLGHGAAARWLSERNKGRGAEFLAMTGEHAERAGETALAIECFERASEEAKARYANTAAVTWSRRALTLLGESAPQRRFDLLARIERVANATGDRDGQDRLHAEMAALLERHPDDACRARLSMSAAMLADIRGDTGLAKQLAQQAFEVAARCGAAETAAESQALLGWMHQKANQATSDGSVETGHIETGLAWAARIAAERNRLKVEAQLLALRGIVVMHTRNAAEARAPLTEALARGEALGAARVQINALANLAFLARMLGLWDEVSAWAARLHAVARSAGVQSAAGFASMQMAKVAIGQGEKIALLDHIQDALAIFRGLGDRRLEFELLYMLAEAHLALDDAQAASDRCAEALLVERASPRSPQDSVTLAAITARVELRLGRRDVALATVNQLIERIDGDRANFAGEDDLAVRWHCHQVLLAVADARAAPLLTQLHADVQAYVGQKTSEADRERMIQAHPNMRAIVAAYQRAAGGGPQASVGRA